MRKRAYKILGLITIMSLVLPVKFSYAKMKASNVVTLTDEASIPTVISEMTLDEKCQMVCGIGLMTPYGGAGSTFGIDRLGIPAVELTDGPQGIRMGGLTITPNYAPKKYATCFPNPLLNGSTWSTELMRQIGDVMAKEGRDYGADVILSPAMNIVRDPLGGRTFEYYSEDPYLIGKLSTEEVKGIQGEGVGACIKHFAGNNQENNRIDGDEIISERALREIYLPQYETTVKNATPWTAMAAYNKVNGTRMTENSYLLNNVLRDQFGFNGMVMSDWGAYNRAEAFKNGLDLNEPGGFYNMAGIVMPAWLLQIKPAVTSWGAIKESDLDRAIKNILKLVIKTPTFKGEYGDKKQFLKKTKLTQNLQVEGDVVSRNLAEEGIVLLKNDNNTLPLKSGNKVLLAGKNVFSGSGIIYEGNGSATVNADSNDVTSLVDGIKNAGFNVTTKVNGDNIEEGVSNEAAIASATNLDAVIISIGLPGHEGSDYSSMNLSDEQEKLIKTLGQAYHAVNKKVIVVLNTGAPVETASWSQYADSILWVGLPGNKGAEAIGNIINGSVNPSGKLTVTWPVKYSDVPDSSYFPKDTKTPVNYKEGIYVGYRYYDSKNVIPQYRFGYGLSYTNFKYSNIKLSSDKFHLKDDNSVINVTADITNTGSVKGKEVAQLYLKASSNVVDRPDKELKGFAKTKLLNPGETETVQFSIDKRSLSYFNETTSSWTAEPGQFTAIVGGTSDDNILQTSGLQDTFNAN